MHVRSLFAAAIAALLVGPLAAQAQAKKPAAQAKPAAAQKLSVGGWIGYEMGDVDGLELRVDGELPYRKLSPVVDLSFVGSLSYSRGSLDVPFGDDVTVSRIKVVPAARFTYPASPQLKLFGDAGLGLHYTSVDYPTIPGFDLDDSEVSLLLRFGAGGLFQVNPQLAVGGMLVLDPIFGDYDDTTFAIMVGATYQL